MTPDASPPPPRALTPPQPRITEQRPPPHHAVEPASETGAPSALKPGPEVHLQGLRAFYGSAEQVKGIDLTFPANEVTAIIGPSGCGKSTMVRCINRMHEEIPDARATGRVLLDGLDLYGPSVDVTPRRAIGMVFKPNPFPTMSILTTSPACG
jgi:phosphate transport system ATP-binding protein